MGISSEDYAVLVARLMCHGQRPEPRPERESKLHWQIDEWTRTNQLPALHHSMAHRAFMTLGWPDFTILMPDQRVLLVECKTATGKLSREQEGLRQWAARPPLCHTIHVVRSFDEFLAVSQPGRINGTDKPESDPGRQVS